VIREAIECALKAYGIERIRRDTHHTGIVAEGPDNIPRPMGFRQSRSPPIEQKMLPAEKADWLPLGALLIREGLITSEQLELALIDQQGTGLRLGELLVQWGWVESGAISRALAEQYDLAFLDLGEAQFDPAAVARLDAKDARSRDAIPICTLDDGVLLVGVADPTDVGACEELRALLGGSISLVVVDQVELHRALGQQYS
jgi:MSHA biogenesis protein MshE